MIRYLRRCAWAVALAVPLAGGCQENCCEVRGPAFSAYMPYDGSRAPVYQPFQNLRSDRACYPPPTAPCPVQTQAPPYANVPAPDLRGYGCLPRGPAAPTTPEAGPIATQPPPLAPGKGPIVRLSVPEPFAPDASSGSAKDDKSQSSAPPVVVDSGGTPSLPVGIARFAEVKPGHIACGLKPHPVDGLSWLQAHGYRVVLHLRQPGETDPADRRVIEKAGLRYVALDASAVTLNRDLVEQFSKLVNNADNQPLFVYDQDGLLAGPLWYLYFRGVENLPEDQAKARAGRLGFKDDGSDAARALWAAARKIQ